MKPGVPFQRRNHGAESLARGSDRPLRMPMPREVLGEIGLLVAVHLALALAVVSTLQTLGIAGD